MTYAEIPGWCDFEWLYTQAAKRATAESVLVEVGVWRGKSIAFLANELLRLGKRPKLFAVDTWCGSLGEANMQADIAELGGPDGLFADFLHNMTACGVCDIVCPLRQPSVEAAKMFQSGSVDFCFVDASHDYESVKADIAAWRPKMKPGGILAGHDMLMAGVAQAVREAFGEGFTVQGSCWLAAYCDDSHRRRRIQGVRRELELCESQS